MAGTIKRDHICLCLGLVQNQRRAKPYLLTVGLQFGFAGGYIFSVASLNHGMSRYVFVVYRNAIAALALAPFALIVRACECKRGAEPSKADWDVGNLFRCFVNDIYKGPQIKLFFSPVTTHHQDGSHSPDEALRDCLSPPRLCRLVSGRIVTVFIGMLIGALLASVVAIVATRHSGLVAWALGWDFRLHGPLYTDALARAYKSCTSLSGCRLSPAFELSAHMKATLVQVIAR
ncbi:hypothetical protein JHK87_014899 [Glycine soja]|nr:hypothetical protein JHK87_014899 [Glycine soja]